MIKDKNCQLLQPRDSLRLEKYLFRYHWSGRRKRRPRHEACRNSILSLFIYPGTFIKSTCNYGLHILRGRVLSLRLPVISILTPPLRLNVAVTSGLYDTACAAGLVRALSQNIQKDAFFHPIHCGFCHRIVSSTNYSSIYFETLISPH